MSKNMINIPSTVEDPNYRYKMPQIITKSEGKGNGIKVNLVNLVDVAKALRVPEQCTFSRQTL
jgi:translation initiation factor 5